MLPPGSSVQRAPSSLEVDLKDNLNAAEGHFRLSASVNLSIFSAVISREMWIVRYKALRAQLQKIHGRSMVRDQSMHSEREDSCTQDMPHIK